MQKIIINLGVLLLAWNSSFGSSVILPVSYNMANGGSGTYSYRDDTYSGLGNRSQNYALLTGGTGQLTNGVLGATDWRVSNGYEWIGWQYFNPTITFDLGQVIDLESFSVHANNACFGGVTIFQSATLSFSEDGQNFSNSINYSVSDIDKANHNAFFVDIVTPRTARYVNVTFARGGEWLFLSEAKFVQTASAPLLSASAVDDAYVSGPQTLPLPTMAVNSLAIHPDATLTMYADDVLTVSEGLTIENGGLLQGSGTINGDVTNYGTIHILLGQKIVNYNVATIGTVASSGSSGGPSYSVGDVLNDSQGVMFFIGDGSIEGDINNEDDGEINFTGEDFSDIQVIVDGNLHNAGEARFFNGLFTFNGAFTQTDTGRVIFDIRGYEQCADYSHLHVVEAANLSGIFEVNLIDNFIPADQSMFDIFEAEGGITFGPNGLNFDLPEGFAWSLEENDTVIRLTYTTVVPEPAVLSLLVLGSAVALRWRKYNV